ncbi:DNA cytosine methyltransferase [Taklimakanibacter deserti]|uniref:DNA cytosine methyltransferase n=1 Tax=Taklimakanibacter deserti TaxID=2267839 RepID=UPI0034D3C758
MAGDRSRKILVADLLCGAGGSSTGCARALAELGLKMELVCVNHWGVAIETHKKNHPEARHYCQDIASVRPHIIVPEGYLDLLMASPTCTHHSVARGGKPTSDQQRSDPWHIITWLTELRVKRMIIENVWEFIGWGPVDPRTGKPIKSRKGEYFNAWIDTIRRLGFVPEWRKLNAADFGDATTRQRFILMARSDNRTVSWPVPTHRKREDGKLELFPGMKHWKPAREIIDWDIKGRSIFNRKKPLAPKTLARIYAGAVKFQWPEPFLVILRNHMDGKSLDGPLPAIAAEGNHIALARPFILGRNGAEGGEASRRARSVDDPTPTSTNRGAGYVVEPFVMAVGSTGAPRSTKEPLPTATTGGAGSEDPGCARPMLLEPMIVTVAHGNEEGDKTADSRRSHSIEQPMGAFHGEGVAHALVEPFVLSRHAGGAPRSTQEPTPAQVAKHSHVLISPYYGSGSGETCNTAEEPLPSPTGKNRFGMIVPVTHTQGGNGARDVETPLPVITTAKGGELAFITAQFGEREGQAPRVHDIEQPAPTPCAQGHINLVEATEGYDILFRMLEPHELAAAMGFNSDEAAYEFAGTKTEKIKQIGNAVSVAKMKACVSAIMADAAPKTASLDAAARQTVAA